MKVLAFDQATKTGWCFGGTRLDLTAWECGRFKAPKRDEEGERLCIIEDGALALLDRFEPDLVAYEEPFDPSWSNAKQMAKGEDVRRQFDRKTMQYLQRVKGAIIMAAARRSVPTEACTTKAWQACIGLPKAPPIIPSDKRSVWKKQEVMRIVKRLGGSPNNLDESDAWGICYYACHGKAGIRRATGDLFEKARSIL